jgi:hypothetical protein
MADKYPFKVGDRVKTHGQTVEPHLRHQIGEVHRIDTHAFRPIMVRLDESVDEGVKNGNDTLFAFKCNELRKR